MNVRAADRTTRVVALAAALILSSCRCDRTPASGVVDASAGAMLDVGARCDDRTMGRRGACSPDAKRSLACEDGKLVVASECTGPKRCEMRFDEGDAGPLAASCDLSAAIEGQACGKYDHARLTCDPARKTQLRCDPITSRWTVDEICKGPCVWDGLEGECAK